VGVLAAQEDPGICNACDKREDESRYQPIETGRASKEQVNPGHEKRNAGKLRLHDPNHQPQKRVTRTRFGIANMRRNLRGPREYRDSEDFSGHHFNWLPWNQRYSTDEKYL